MFVIKIDKDVEVIVVHSLPKNIQIKLKDIQLRNPQVLNLR